MEISELISKKKDLQDKIAQEIAKFEQETSINVRDIEIHKIEVAVNPEENKGFQPKTAPKICVEVTLCM